MTWIEWAIVITTAATVAVCVVLSNAMLRPFCGVGRVARRWAILARPGVPCYEDVRDIATGSGRRLPGSETVPMRRHRR